MNFIKDNLISDDDIIPALSQHPQRMQLFAFDKVINEQHDVLGVMPDHSLTVIMFGPLFKPSKESFLS